MRTIMIAVVLLLVLTGCPSDPPEATPPEPLPSVQHPAVPVPRDRDEGAVTSALARLDACAFLDPARVPDFPGTGRPRLRGPHQCEIATTGERSTVVTLGFHADAAHRFGMERFTASGATLYAGRTSTSCEVMIPVSFTRGIRFAADAGSDCRHVRGFAVAAAATLTKGTPPVATAPPARWDACTVLRSALPAAHRAHPAERFAEPGGIDSCRIATAPRRPTTLQLTYGDPPKPDPGTTVRAIGGKRVLMWGSPSHCNLTWVQGPAGTSDPDRAALVVHLDTFDCAAADGMAALAVAALAGSAPRRATPQQPLVYRAGQVDTAAVGACADLGPDWRCQPYHQVSAPGGEVARKAAADPNVDCAVAVEAARRFFGSGLRPVVSTGQAGMAPAEPGCVLVEPTGAVRIWVSITPDGLSGALRSEAGGSRTETHVDDRPAVRREHEQPGYGRSISVRLTDDPNGPHLHGMVQLSNPRGAVDRGDEPRNRATADRLLPMVAAIHAKSF